MENKKINPILSELYKGIDTMIDTKKVVGDPQIFGDTVIIPLVEMSFAMGAGAFEQGIFKKDNQRGMVGAKIKPTAVLVIKNGRTSVIDIGTTTAVERLIELAPDLIEKLKNGFSGNKQERDEIINRAFNK